MPDTIPTRPTLKPRTDSSPIPARPPEPPVVAPAPQPAPPREKPPLRLKEQPRPRRRGKEEPANPLLQRMPEPRAPFLPPRLARALRVTGALAVLGLLVAGLLLFLNVGEHTDAAPWQRSLSILQTLEEKPADADALDGLKDLIAAIPDEPGNRSTLSGLKAVYALGLLGRGRNPEGLAACRHVLKHYPDAGFAEFVTFSNLTVRGEAPPSAAPTPRQARPPAQLGSTARGDVNRLGDTLPAPSRPAGGQDKEVLSRIRIKEQYDAALKKAVLLCRLKEAESAGRAALLRFQEGVKSAVTNELAPAS